MRCHYEVLGLQLTATNDEIKKAYRKCALQWHPDKHVGSSGQEEAQKKFLEVQDAYETLIDPQERAWYDSHREVLINGGTPGEKNDANYMFNIYPFFSPTCFKGFGDDENGFYTVYREMFIKIAEEDRPYYEEGVTIPEFGTSTSDYESVVGLFYAFWMSYCTPRSFVWKEEYDTRDAQDRQVRRAMEKENKKLRDKAKKERNEEIRQIVSIVRKKDKRVEQYKKLLEEKALLAQKKSQEKREADRQRRAEQMKNYVEPEWSAVDKKLEELDLAENEAKQKQREPKSDDENENDETGENTVRDEDYDEEFDESLFCVACNKSFKNTKSFENHEKSKKHRENVELLKKLMREEDKNALFGEENKETEESKTIQKPKMSKKQKKKRNKQNKNLDNSSDDEEQEEPEEAEFTTDNIEVELKQENNDSEDEKIKSKHSKKEKKKNKSQKNNSNEEDNEPSEVVAPKEVEEPSPKQSVCSICNETFESRTKLFAHIKEQGHAALKTEPLSHNALKKQKRLLKNKK